MTEPSSGLSAMLKEVLATALGGPKSVVRNTFAATLAVVEALLKLLDAGVAGDIRRIKESLIASSEAEAQAKVAEAAKKTAEAVEAANRANLARRNDAMAKAEKRRAMAEADRIQAEADAIRTDADTRRLEQVVTAAETRLFDAVAKLNEEGGKLLVDRYQFLKLLENPMDENETNHVDREKPELSSSDRRMKSAQTKDEI